MGKSEEITKISGVLKVLSHPLHLAILVYIKNQGETPVSNIYRSLEIEQSITSTALGKLRKAGLVLTQREGKKVIYSINEQGFENSLDTFKKHWMEEQVTI